MKDMKVRLSGICHNSLVNGQGLRKVLFAQGCKHNCKDCFNSVTHSFDGGKLFNVEDLIQDILNSKLIDGVTFSGGDPFEQSESFSYIAKELRKRDINIWCYTGYTYEQILQDENKLKLLKLCDVLVDGKFKKELKDLTLKFRGSSNQRIIDVKESLKQNEVILYNL